MLPTREVISEVARLFRETALPAPVVDPVMRATSGDDLIDDNAVSCLVSDLFPLARLVTPNIPEAERLTGLTIGDEGSMREAALRIRKMGARAVLVKGGHLGSRAANSEEELQAIDVLDNEGRVSVFRAEMVSGGEIHGSGCTLSAAIAACLGQGMPLEDAVAKASSLSQRRSRRHLRLGTALECCLPIEGISLEGRCSGCRILPESLLGLPLPVR